MLPFSAYRTRGFSLVELMVAMLIALIGTIIIFQVFEVSEGIRRSTTSGGDAQQNGAVALYLMEHDLRNAGAGFNDVGFAGCRIRAYDATRATQNFNLLLAPALICAPGSTNPGGMCPGTGVAGTSPDRLTVFYGSNPWLSDAHTLSSPFTAGDTQTIINSVYGYKAGDLMVLFQPPVGASNCSLMEATGVGLPLLTSSLAVGLAQAGAAYPLSTGTQVVARMNPLGGLGVNYTAAPSANVTRVYNLGNLYDPANGSAMPVLNTYAIDPAGRTLTVSSAFVIDTTTKAPLVTAVADNIVHMRALYGLDDGVVDGSVEFNKTPPGVAGDGRVDRLLPAATFNALASPPWQSLIAVRVAIVARSALAEKPHGSNGTDCDATTDGTEPGPPSPVPDTRPRWSAGVIDVSASGDPTASSPANWKCYRYRVFETTVPLRNWIWKAS